MVKIGKSTYVNILTVWQEGKITLDFSLNLWSNFLYMATYPSVQAKNKILKPKEAKALEYYLLGDMNQNEAMELAGYKNMHPETMRRIFRKIVAKYEAHTGDKAQILRDCQAGEMAVAKTLAEGMDTAQPMRTRLIAADTAMRGLRMIKEENQAGQGVTVIVAARDDSKVQVNVTQQKPPDDEPESTHPKPARPGQPIMITE